MRRLVEAWKSIPSPVKWTAPDREDGYTRFYSPIEIDGITEAGLALTGGSYVRRPDRHVTFELSASMSGGFRRTRLIRLDWRSLRGGHSNDRRCPGQWSGARVPSTHLHCFDLNWLEVEGRMRRGKLPCARPIEQELQTFDDLRQFVGSHFRINNIGLVPPPEWAYDLFSGE
jgi:hypothetical protein